MHVLCVNVDAVGWKNYSRHFTARLIAERPDIFLSHSLRPDYIARILYRLERYVRPERFANHIFNNRRASRSLINRYASQKVEHILFADQAIAGGAVDFAADRSFSVALDVTGMLRRKAGFREQISEGGMDSEREVFSAAKLLFPMSEWVKGSLINDYGIPAEKITVIPPSVDAPPAQANILPATTRYRIIFIGDDFRRKGGDMLVEAVSKHLADVCEVVIASKEGHEFAGMSGVIHLGSVPNHILRTAVLPHCDIHVLPTNQDMSPWGIVEANAACIPTISTNLGGIPELIHSDEGRLLMNEATTDAIAERIDYVIGEKSRLPDLKAKAYEKYMAHQNIDRNAKRLQSLLLGAIDSSPRLNAFQAQAAG